MGTDDASLIRIVVSRCEVDMIQIKDEFEKNFKKPLGQFIAVSQSLKIIENFKSYSVCNFRTTRLVIMLPFY